MKCWGNDNMLKGKQRDIFNKICLKFELPFNNVFVQHRNLNEFRSFGIEKVNPNHRIILYGKLRKNYIKDNHPNKIIRVGEILIAFTFPITNDTVIITSLMAFHMFYTFFIINNFEELVFESVNRYRGKCRKWKNSLCGSLRNYRLSM